MPPPRHSLTTAAHANEPASGPGRNSSPPPRLPSANPPVSVDRTSHRMSALPSSTSESHLVRVQRAPLPPKPPAQPTKVRPFILRGTSSSTAAQSRPAAGRAADHAQGDKTGHEVGALKKSKTSVDVAVHAESTRSSESSRADKDRRRRTAAVRSDFGMTSTIEKGTAADFDAGGRRVGLTRSPPMPSSSTTASTSSSAPRRPISLAASSLRALSSTSSDTHPSPTPRARPLSYVSSATTNTTSPPRRRPLSFSASPSPPNKVRPSSSASIGAAPRAPPVISPTRARALSPAASAAVEAHKAALKRRMLAARRQGADVSDTVAPAEPEQGATQGGMRRSGRWFGRLASASNGDENASLEAGSQEERSDAALTSGRSTVGGRRSVDGLRMAGGRPPTTPPVRGLGKKASLTALGRGHVRPEPVVEPSPVRVVEDETGPGFSSLQDLLERHGYAETRVITPQTQEVRPVDVDEPDDRAQAVSARAPSSAAAPAVDPGTLAPPTQPSAGKGLRERSSLLSLRGWFSLFSPSPESDDDGDIDDEDAVEVLADSAIASATDSPQPRLRTASEVLHWVDGVNQEYPPPVLPNAPHPLSRSSLPVPSSASLESTPQLVQYRSRRQEEDDDDSASARSYSSSLSFDYSPTPHHPLHSERAHSFCPTIAISAEADSPTKPRGGLSVSNALVLRHAASDSHLPTSTSTTSSMPFPRYESFSGLGLSLPPPSPVPSPPHTPQRVATPPPAPGAFSGMWVPSLLRERASQLFSFSSTSHASSSSAHGGASTPRPPSPFASPIDAATGLSPSQRRLLTAAQGLARLGGSHGLKGRGDRAPQLLRKAVSAGGLRVAAIGAVTRARVETKSSRESLGSLEAAPVRVGGDAVASAWGEDLLGRRW